MTLEERTQKVREHAQANYNQEGWDIVIECWTDQDIAEAIRNCKTVKQSIKEVGRVVGAQDEQRKDIESTIW